MSYASLEHFTARTATQPESRQPHRPTIASYSAGHDDAHRKYAKITRARIWVNGEGCTRVSYASLEHFTAHTATQPEIDRPSCPTLTYYSAGHDDAHRKYAKITHARI